MASQQELEERWLVKLGDARARYDEAKASKAQEEESAALKEEYLRVLRIISDVVMRGRMPPEE